MLRLLTIVTLITTALHAHADEKKSAPAITEIVKDKSDKIESEKGKVSEPTVVDSEKELEKAIPDEATRKRIAKLVDFKEQKLLVFVWQGSGNDKLDHIVLERYPEIIKFGYAQGDQEDLRWHVRMFAIRNNVTWSVK